MTKFTLYTAEYEESIKTRQSRETLPKTFPSNQGLRRCYDARTAKEYIYIEEKFPLADSLGRAQFLSRAVGRYSRLEPDE